MTILQILTVIIAFGTLIVNMLTQKSNIENVEKLVYYKERIFNFQCGFKKTNHKTLAK